MQHDCFQHFNLGMDILCQARSGTGKTTFYIIAILQQIDPIENSVQALVITHSRELSKVIEREFFRYEKYLTAIKCHGFVGGISTREDIEYLKSETPNIVIGTPGKLINLVKQKNLDISKVKYFVIDDCQNVLESIGM